MVKLPDLAIDGWCVEDGEERHREAPSTFFIPDVAIREILQPGDFAKLIFRIALEDENEPESVERMWVIVRERVPGGYVGILDNEPNAIAPNDSFWRGSEIPFEPRHIIDVDHANDESRRVVSEATRPASDSG